MKWNEKTFERYNQKLNLLPCLLKQNFFKWSPFQEPLNVFTLDLPNFYPQKLREQSESLVPEETRMLNGHNFGNSSLLSKLEVNK